MFTEEQIKDMIERGISERQYVRETKKPPPAVDVMTPLDNFAAFAMIAYYMDPEIADSSLTPEAVASWSYDMAGCMMNEREKVRKDG